MLTSLYDFPENCPKVGDEVIRIVITCTVSALQCVALPTGHLGESVLLPLRLPVPGVHHLGGLLLSDQHCHGLFSAVCRGKWEHRIDLIAITYLEFD